jgi:hypothetical protein
MNTITSASSAQTESGVAISTSVAMNTATATAFQSARGKESHDGVRSSQRAF